MELHHREKTVSVAREKAVLVGCMLPEDGLDPHDPLGELASLAETAGAQVVGTLTQRRMKPDAKTFIGHGKVEELAELVRLHGAQVVLFENNLSPSQISNIEKVVGCKILDRTELILDIFAFRARTPEAKLQVELSQLMYTYPRLKSMWTHLERTAGGVGTRGPGEQQLETDRRLVQVKRLRLERELAEIEERKKREVESRNNEHYTVGIVGYTNAGKSTLLNAMTGSTVEAADQLFMTLDPTSRRLRFPREGEVVITDTVGFIADLPKDLVAAFRATLEELADADLLLHVVDAADPRRADKMQAVEKLLATLDLAETERLVVFNKADLLAPGEAEELARQHGGVAVSAVRRQGFDRLIRAAEERLGRKEPLLRTYGAEKAEAEVPPG